ncbi:DUF4097 family beta strand repeat-containing protein [Paenibacillus wulumuqiensis]|uniref:DUF4097 family beta strand repeat-containing protein n=1 Tax=Paenibacillus wulumuqiensis TaxID=1567107 RepID=UPI00061911B9|nr:DUF4097 family beta strand repeat-containing protein [Paenibacillus wulumuqiensis]
MKRSISILVTVIIIVAILVIGYLVYNRVTGAVTIHEEKTLSASAITSLKIDTSSANVEVLPGDGENIVATLDGEISPRLEGKYTFNMTPEQNVANIQLNMGNNVMGIQLDEVSKVGLKIMVPQKTWDQMEVTTTSGQITLHNIAANKLTTESSSGQQHISGLQISGSAAFQTTSGDIMAEQNEIASAKWETTSGKIQTAQLSGQSSEMQTTSGAIEYTQNELSPSVQLATSSGDIDAKLTGNTDSLQLQFESSSGTADIQIEGMLYKDKSEHSALGIKGEGEAQHRIMLKTSSGDVQVGP